MLVSLATGPLPRYPEPPKSHLIRTKNIHAIAEVKHASQRFSWSPVSQEVRGGVVVAVGQELSGDQDPWGKSRRVET